MPPQDFAPLRLTRSTADGVVGFVRTGSRVRFHLAYRDPVQVCPDPGPTRASITAAVDALRDQAVAAMRTTIAGLMGELLPRLSSAGPAVEFFDPSFRSDIVIPRIGRQAGLLSVRLPPFYCTLTDTDASRGADRFLAEEYGRAVVRQRVAELWGCYEEARRDLLEGAAADG
jgi:hypothetical protein